MNRFEIENDLEKYTEWVSRLGPNSLLHNWIQTHRDKRKVKHEILDKELMKRLDSVHWSYFVDWDKLNRPRK